MLTYSEHYAQYIGYNSEQKGNLIVCHSPLREKLKAHRKPLLVSFLNKKQVVLSLSSDLLNVFKRHANDLVRKTHQPDALFKTLDDIIFTRFKHYQIEKFIRMTVGSRYLKSKRNHDRKVRPLVLMDRNAILNIGKLPDRGGRFRDNVWSQNIVSIREGRNFGVIGNGRIISWAMVEPIECHGGNIAVWTSEKHRKKGYGKMVVSVAVEWCIDHGILPIYSVRDDNKASIALAKSLGFVMKNKEIIVSHWPGDAWNKYKVNDQTQN